MHKPYRIGYQVEVKERGKKPYVEDRVAYMCARNPANAERRLAKRLCGCGPSEAGVLQAEKA